MPRKEVLLEPFSWQLEPDEQAVLVLDQAGFIAPQTYPLVHQFVGRSAR